MAVPALALLAIAVVAAVASMLLTAQLQRYLTKKALLDIPNERSSHNVPVPRGGGMAVMAVVIIGMMGVLPKGLVVFCGALLLVAVSIYDDRKGASAGMRFGAHLLAAAGGAVTFGSDQFLLGGALPFWLDRIVMVIGWAWFMNLYNFMDGIDGITGVETISLAVGVGVILWLGGWADSLSWVLAALLAGSMLGFLRHNWHPAKIFLGDSGSVPLGFLTGYLLINLAVHGQIAAALILPLYYVADSGITLVKRVLRGEKVWQAHRQHYYQQAALGVGRHDKIAVWIAITDCGLIGAAVASLYFPVVGIAGAIVIVAILLIKMHKSASLTPAQS